MFNSRSVPFLPFGIAWHRLSTLGDEKMGKVAWGKERENEPLYEVPHGRRQNGRLLSTATATERWGMDIMIPDVSTSNHGG